MPRRRSSFSQRDAQDAAKLFAQLPRQAQIALIVLAIIAGLIFLLICYHQQHRPAATATTNAPTAAGDLSDTLDENLFLGNPSDASTGLFNRTNYLLDKKYYALSYNNDTGEANWVSWRLTRADLGSSPRKPEFDPDLSLPATFTRITTHDYVGSGFDRGHLCPHGDRAAFPEQSDSTFVMSNIVPQSHLINEGVWGDEEDYLRRVVRGGHRLYIVAGPAGRGGSGASGPQRTTIAAGKVVVPASTWKVAVVTDETGGPDNLASINERSRVIAVIMPNDSHAAGGSWLRFRERAADIEQKTGLHFFTKLPAAVREGLLQQQDQQSE